MVLHLVQGMHAVDAEIMEMSYFGWSSNSRAGSGTWRCFVRPLFFDANFFNGSRAAICRAFLNLRLRDAFESEIRFYNRVRGFDDARAAELHRLDRHMSGQIVGRDTMERIEERGLEAARSLRQRGGHCGCRLEHGESRNGCEERIPFDA